MRSAADNEYFQTWTESVRREAGRLLAGVTMWPEDWEDTVMEFFRDLAETSDFAIMVWKSCPPGCPRGQVLYDYSSLEEEPLWRPPGEGHDREEEEQIRQWSLEAFRKARLRDPNSTWVFPAGLRWVYSDDVLAEAYYEGPRLDQ